MWIFWLLDCVDFDVICVGCGVDANGAPPTGEMMQEFINTF